MESDRESLSYIVCKCADNKIPALQLSGGGGINFSYFPKGFISKPTMDNIASYACNEMPRMDKKIELICESRVHENGDYIIAVDYTFDSSPENKKLFRSFLKEAMCIATHAPWLLYYRVIKNKYPMIDKFLSAYLKIIPFLYACPQMEGRGVILEGSFYRGKNIQEVELFLLQILYFSAGKKDCFGYSFEKIIDPELLDILFDEKSKRERVRGYCDQYLKGDADESDRVDLLQKIRETYFEL